MKLRGNMQSWVAKGSRFGFLALTFITQFIVVISTIMTVRWIATRPDHVTPYKDITDTAINHNAFTLTLTVISVLIATTAPYFRYRAPYVSVYVLLVGVLLDLSIIAYPSNTNILIPASLMAYHVGRSWERKWRIDAFIIGWVLIALDFIKFIALGIIFDEQLHVRLDSPVKMTFMVLGYLLQGGLLSLMWFIGNSRRLGALHQQELRERANRLEEERRRARLIAAQDERARIAREMHDIVAHSLSSIITQADGARYAAGAVRNAPGETNQLKAAEIAGTTLSTIAGTARDSLTQMRSLLGVLRMDDDTPYAPSPTLAEIPTLVNKTCTSGVALKFAGIKGTQRKPMPQGAELAAYRVVQESLTNILKYARDAQNVQLSVKWGRQGLNISVYNSEPRGTYEALPGSGNGLRGMTERISMYGGALHYGPDLHGGFEVRTHLPYRGS